MGSRDEPRFGPEGSEDRRRALECDWDLTFCLGKCVGLTGSQGSPCRSPVPRRRRCGRAWAGARAPLLAPGAGQGGGGAFGWRSGGVFGQEFQDSRMSKIKTCDAVSGAAPYPRVIRNGDVSARRGWSDAFWSRRGVTSEKTVCRFCLPKGYSAAHSVQSTPKSQPVGGGVCLGREVVR